MTQSDSDYCAVCRFALDMSIDLEAGVTWHHGASYSEWTGKPHDPQPVPLAQLVGANIRCDFCTHGIATWSYRFDHLVLKVPALGITRDYGTWWACCDLCASFLDDRNIIGLVARVAVLLDRPAREIERLYDRLLPTLHEKRSLPRTGC